MTDFTAERPFSYVAGALIDPDENNPNENTLYDAHNAAFHATTGHAHSGATGDAPQINLTSAVTGTLPVAKGGTSYASYTIGDILQASASGVLSKLAAVATGNVLISGGVATVSSWGKVDLTAHITGVLDETNGGTGQSTVTTGDLLYGNGSNVWAKLAAAATGNVLISGTNPSWGKVVLTTHVSGTLPVANGGTGVTTSTGSGANVLGTSPTITTPSIAGCTMSGTWTSSSCTLSGTFAGTPTFSGVITFSANVVFSGNPNFTGNPDFDDEIIIAAIDPPTADRLVQKGTVKAYLHYNDGSASVSDSFNIVGLSDDDGDGLYSITWDTNMNDTNDYACAGACLQPATAVAFTSNLSSGINVRIWDISAGLATDYDFYVIAAGDQ